MEWIPRDVIHPDLPKGRCDYVDVVVNLRTPVRLETTVMTYFPPEYDCDGTLLEGHRFIIDNPQSWHDNFTHYCLLPEACGGKDAKQGYEQLTIPVVVNSVCHICDIPYIFDAEKRTYTRQCDCY